MALVDKQKQQTLHDTLRYSIMATSLWSGVVVAYVNYVSPQQQWLLLRGAAVTMEGQIWKFRTRTGEYQGYATTSRLDSHKEEAKLEQSLNRIDEELMQSDAVSSSDFRTYLAHRNEGLLPRPAFPEIFRHGQYRPVGSDSFRNWVMKSLPKRATTHGGKDPPVAEQRPSKSAAYEKARAKADQSRRVPDPSEDQHHCPCGPDDYLEIRVDSLIQFYETRIPKYFQWRKFVQVLTLLASVISTLLASLNYSEIVPIVTVIGASFTGWAEFRSITKKLQRYNFVVRNLTALRLWWMSLTPVDRASLRHVDHLVCTAEEIVSQEFFQWQAGSRRTAEMLAATGAEKAEAAGTKGEDGAAKKGK
jgi:hypothetical protein